MVVKVKRYKCPWCSKVYQSVVPRGSTGDRKQFPYHEIRIGEIKAQCYGSYRIVEPRHESG